MGRIDSGGPAGSKSGKAGTRKQQQSPSKLELAKNQKPALQIIRYSLEYVLRIVLLNAGTVRPQI